MGRHPALVRRVAAGALICFAFNSQLHAQAQPEAASPELRFDIARFDVQGNTLLKPDVVSRIVAPFVGRKKDFSDVQRALEALEVAYRNAGYGVVQVTLPEQNIAAGIVALTVIEPRLGRVDVEGNEFSDARNVRRSLPALREGAVPNSRQIARDLLVANENPSRQVTVLMRSSETEDKVDATIKVVDEKPWKASLSLDNTGNQSTGEYRLNAGYQHTNLFNRDHVLTAQYTTSPNHYGDVKVYGAGYKIPFYEWSSSFELVGGYSNVNSGTVGGLFNVSGSGTIGAARWNYTLPKIADYEHKLVYGLDYKAFSNQVLSAGQNISPDITVHPIGIMYQGTLRQETGEAGFYLNVAQNIVGGSDDSDADFKASRSDARAAYRLVRYGAHYTRAFADDWQARVQWLGQWTVDALVSGEQFGVGGPDSVRGFLVRELANDRGNQLNGEIYTPNLGGRLGMPDAQLRLLVFTDWGFLTRNSAQSGESTNQSIGSVGLGLRMTANQRFIGRMDYARVIDAGGGENKGHTKLNFSLTATF